MQFPLFRGVFSTRKVFIEVKEHTIHIIRQVCKSKYLPTFKFTLSQFLIYDKN